MAAENVVIGFMGVLVTPLAAVEVVPLPRPLFPELYHPDSSFEGEWDVTLVLCIMLDSFCVGNDHLCFDVWC